MDPELPEPVIHRLLVHMAQFLCLQDRNLLRPAPHKSPECAQVQSHVLQPRVREQREVSPASGAPISILLTPHMPRPAIGTEHVLSENNVTKPFLDLGV